jgi:hypothetical protein
VQRRIQQHHLCKSRHGPPLRTFLPAQHQTLQGKMREILPALQRRMQAQGKVLQVQRKMRQTGRGLQEQVPGGGTAKEVRQEVLF